VIISDHQFVVIDFIQNHHVAKGLYGVQFPYYDILSSIYARDIDTCKGAKYMSDAVNNMELELVAGTNNDEEEEDLEKHVDGPLTQHHQAPTITRKNGKRRPVYQMTHLTCSMK
jgi:hypothetical protein